MAQATDASERSTAVMNGEGATREPAKRIEFGDAGRALAGTAATVDATYETPT